ncbi:beta-glucanosyltransferase [Glutinoglossum americanum]|uniref:1,3-beta-glucanosyltransferase n=1 Tax=Glutinoglossum americanum TaxID=1670608 RepID=A0A9P8L2T0_9PEZI|nr:beta-glucanosyltransferase [Glutinoglossum americanum]
MKGLGAIISTTVALTAAGAMGASIERRTLPAVSAKGNAFFAGNDRFYIRGVDYQPGGSSLVADPIADESQCKRDIAEFKKLGINTVRVYTVDNTASHDACMSALDAAGIYLVLDVNTPKYSLNRAQPDMSYNDVYLQNVFATIDAFQKYSNVLAFFSGNEVINDDASTSCAPYVKAVTRDMRQYIKARGYRQIPVGYSAADVSSNRKQMADYMNCGSDDVRSDFFAFNDYSWCDPSSFKTSGWDQKVKNFSDYSIPLFLSEYGCNTNTRKFEEVASLYSTDMTPVFSGGLVYEYSEEGSKYGLVTINGDSVTEGDDFNALKDAYAATSNPSGDGGYKANGSPSKCPSQSADWNVTTDSLPSIPSPAQKFMTSGAGTGAGLSGPGSQTAGTPSEGFSAGGSSSSSGKPKSSAAGPRHDIAFNSAWCTVLVLASSFLSAAAFL